MWSSLVRHVVHPLHERLLGRATVRCARELEQSQWMSPRDLRQEQDRKLAALLRHSAEHVPYYRILARTGRVAPSDGDPRAALARLPLLSKDDIRAHGPAMVWHDAPGGVFPHNTGGSTGEPLIFHFDRRRQAYDQAARIRTHRWFDVKLGDRELLLWGSPIELRRTDRLRSVRDRLLNQLMLNAFAMSPERMDIYLGAMRRFSPHALFGYPSSLALLADHAARRGDTGATGDLRAIFVTGEVCYPHHRRTLSRVFGAPVADGYGSREAGFIAHECPSGAMHIMAENVIVEILRDGTPVAEGEEGEIVVTHLDAYAMPFIRYRTGDIGKLRAGRCACGRGLPLMDMVNGRSTDFLYLPDGTIRHALSIIYPLRELEGVRQFRVRQHRDYATTVSIVALPGQTGLTGEIVSRAVRGVVGQDVRLDVEFVPDIPPLGSGKHRYVISEASPPDARSAAAEPQSAGVTW